MARFLVFAVSLILFCGFAVGALDLSLFQKFIDHLVPLDEDAYCSMTCTQNAGDEIKELAEADKWPFNSDVCNMIQAIPECLDTCEEGPMKAFMTWLFVDSPEQACSDIVLSDYECISSSYVNALQKCIPQCSAYTNSSNPNLNGLVKHYVAVVCQTYKCTAECVTGAFQCNPEAIQALVGAGLPNLRSFINFALHYDFLSEVPSVCEWVGFDGVPYPPCKLPGMC